MPVKHTEAKHSHRLQYNQKYFYNQMSPPLLTIKENAGLVYLYIQSVYVRVTCRSPADRERVLHKAPSGSPPPKEKQFMCVMCLYWPAASHEKPKIFFNRPGSLLIV